MQYERRTAPWPYATNPQCVRCHRIICGDIWERAGTFACTTHAAEWNETPHCTVCDYGQLYPTVGDADEGLICPDCAYAAWDHDSACPGCGCTYDPAADTYDCDWGGYIHDDDCPLC